jgi:hypothetical protein
MTDILIAALFAAIFAVPFDASKWRVVRKAFEPGGPDTSSILRCPSNEPKVPTVAKRKRRRYRR